MSNPQLTREQFLTLTPPEMLQAVQEGRTTELLADPAGKRAYDELFQGLSAAQILELGKDPEFLAKAKQLRLQVLTGRPDPEQVLALRKDSRTHTDTGDTTADTRPNGE